VKFEYNLKVCARESIASVREGIIMPEPRSLESPGVNCMAYAHRPSLLVSQNPLGLPHEKELAKRRQLAHERSQRAATEALQILRAGREQQQSNGNAQNADKTDERS
jgi:hypothetical protein